MFVGRRGLAIHLEPNVAFPKLCDDIYATAEMSFLLNNECRGGKNRIQLCSLSNQRTKEMVHFSSKVLSLVSHFTL